MNAARIQIVRGAPVRYLGAAVAFPVPAAATVARVQTNPRAFTRSARVWSVRYRLAPDGKGFPDLGPAGGAVTIGAAGSDGGFVSDAVDVCGVGLLVLALTTAEGGSADVLEDVVVVFDAGDPVPSDRPYA